MYNNESNFARLAITLVHLKVSPVHYGNLENRKAELFFNLSINQSIYLKKREKNIISYLASIQKRSFCEPKYKTKKKKMKSEQADRTSKYQKGENKDGNVKSASEQTTNKS